MCVKIGRASFLTYHRHKLIWNGLKVIAVLILSRSHTHTHTQKSFDFAVSLPARNWVLLLRFAWSSVLCKRGFRWQNLIKTSRWVGSRLPGPGQNHWWQMFTGVEEPCVVDISRVIWRAGRSQSDCHFTYFKQMWNWLTWTCFVFEKKKMHLLYMVLAIVKVMFFRIAKMMVSKSVKVGFYWLWWSWEYFKVVLIPHRSS